MRPIDSYQPGASGVRRLLLALVGSIVLLGSLVHQPAAQEQQPQPERRADLKTTLIPVDGMVCISCVVSVKRAIRSMDGVTAVEVSLEKQTAQVTYAPGKLSPEQFVKAINKLGYKAGLPRAIE